MSPPAVALWPAGGVSAFFLASHHPSLDSASCPRSCISSGAPSVTACACLPRWDLEGRNWVRPGAPGASAGAVWCRRWLAGLGIRARVEGCLGTRPASLVPGEPLSITRCLTTSSSAAGVGPPSPSLAAPSMLARPRPCRAVSGAPLRACFSSCPSGVLSSSTASVPCRLFRAA